MAFREIVRDKRGGSKLTKSCLLSVSSHKKSRGDGSLGVNFSLYTALLDRLGRVPGDKVTILFDEETGVVRFERGPGGSWTLSPHSRRKSDGTVSCCTVNVGAGKGLVPIALTPIEESGIRFIGSRAFEFVYPAPSFME